MADCILKINNKQTVDLLNINISSVFLKNINIILLKNRINFRV